MKHNSLLSLAALAAAGGMTSCISEEPLNMECDIEQAQLLPSDVSSLFYHDFDAHVSVPSTSDSICFVAKPHASVGQIPLQLTLTPGARAYRAGESTPWQNGTALDFSHGQEQRFRVVSEDGEWERQYRIMVRNEKATTTQTLHFSFDDYALNSAGKYYEWQAEGEAANIWLDGKWKNGNPGYSIPRTSAQPMEYPSVPVPGGGPDGSDCVKLETCDTGSFGAMVNMRIASGSMFNGIFDLTYALKDALVATRFGSPFKHKPVRVSCWLKFEPGERFQDKRAQTVEGVVDEPDFYAGIYRNTDAEGNAYMLNGYDVITSPQIVGFARIPHHYTADGADQLSGEPIHGITGEWQKVTLELQYNEELDPVLLENNGYSLYIGFSSSWQGAYFQGAVGSKLWIDELEVECE